MIKKTINKLFQNFLIWNNPFYFYGIPKKDYSIHNEYFHLNKLGLQVRKGSSQMAIIKGYPFALKIKEILSGKFTIANENVLLELKDLKFKINSAEELFIIYEVFGMHVYKYCLMKDTCFVDIGMNSCITTLYYAQNPMVKKIFAYELFKPTFLLGKKNLTLNEKYSDKVKAFNYGLSNKDYQTSIDYSLSRKGRMGLNGLPNDEIFEDVTREDVIVKDISSEFESIISDSSNHDIIVKMDCEGEEYNLIQRLADRGLLAKLTILIIEWHYVHPVEMENYLKASNFHVFSQTLPSLDSGMIYAGNRRCLD
jgi:FkbM family methyltransferase